MNEPATIAHMLRARTLVVVGLSDDPMKPSNSVSSYMQAHGYNILPVNPTAKTIFGEPCFATLTDLVAALGAKPDVVNVFRLPKFIPAIVDEMIVLGLTDLWVQLGIVHLDAARKAEAAGIRVVMDRCILVEHRHSR